MLVPSRVFDPAKAWYLDFGGAADDYRVVIPSNSAFAPATNIMSINFWVYMKSSATTMSVLWRYDAGTDNRSFFVRLNVYSAGDVNVAFYQSNVGVYRDNFYTAGSSVATNQWVNIHIEYDCSGATTVAAIYVDNVDKSLSWETKTNLSQIYDVSEPISIGWRYDTTPRVPLDGYLTNMSFWDRTVSARERGLLATGVYLTGRESGLIAYYPYLDKTGTTLKDWSNNGNDGTITGATWTKGT